MYNMKRFFISDIMNIISMQVVWRNCCVGVKFGNGQVKGVQFLELLLWVVLFILLVLFIFVGEFLNEENVIYGKRCWCFCKYIKELILCFKKVFVGLILLMCECYFEIRCGVNELKF